MNRRLALLFLFASAAFPQAPGKQFTYQSAQTSCPVELKAEWDGAGRLLPVGSHARVRPLRLRIILSKPLSEITSARIAVHGFPVGVRVRPAVLYLPDDPAEITKIVAFDRAVSQGQSASMRFDFPEFGTVTAIDLDSVVYADGSLWHPERRSDCRAVSLSMRAVGDAISR